MSGTNSKSKLCSFYTAFLLDEIYLCMKFQVDTPYTFRKNKARTRKRYENFKKPKFRSYISKSYGSCALHFSSMRSIYLWSFKLIPLILLSKYGPDKKKVWKISKGNNSEIMKERVMVLEHCTSPQWDLSTYEVSSWYLLYFLKYGPDKIKVWKISKASNSEILIARVMVLMHCTFPQWDLSTYEVSSWYLL